MVWDEEYKGANMQIQNKGKTVIKRTEDDYETILATVPLSSGKHKWEIVIDRFSSEEDLFIGVATKEVSLYSRPPDIGNFWGYIATSGKKFGTGGVVDEYSEVAGSGDVIGIVLEWTGEKATLSFTKN